mmetsp:Transcript_36520/g.79972  ORF Transcript_36520/g.79972 Transcript_36520/m.79972 type:complete len:503 (+) Transcript_36520:41-1549(+)
MARKKRTRKGTEQSHEGGSAKVEGAEARGVAARVRGGAFCIKSSLGVPFLVVSDRQLVADLPSPSSEEQREIMALCSSITDVWVVRKAVVLADFEGELMGLEGELVSAAFQRTFSLDPMSLRPLPLPGVGRDMGLLIDLGCEKGRGMVKRIMESDSISKVIWGADGDAVSLLFTPVPRPLGIRCTRVLDAQLAFSSVGKRLGMAKMLERLPAESIAGLPQKAGIDFDTAHSLNCRALPLPLEKKLATYAVDDLHRLEAVLRSYKVASGAYAQAERTTSSLFSLILSRPSASTDAKIRQMQSLLPVKTGVARLALAVRIKRHLMALRRLAPSEFPAQFDAVETEAAVILSEAGVAIPEDLSFGHVREMGLEKDVKTSTEREEVQSSDAIHEVVATQADAVGTPPVQNDTKTHDPQRQTDSAPQPEDSMGSLKKSKRKRKLQRERNPKNCSPSAGEVADGTEEVAGRPGQKQKRRPSRLPQDDVKSDDAPAGPASVKRRKKVKG